MIVVKQVDDRMKRENDQIAVFESAFSLTLILSRWERKKTLPNIGYGGRSALRNKVEQDGLQEISSPIGRGLR